MRFYLATVLLLSALFVGSTDAFRLRRLFRLRTVAKVVAAGVLLGKRADGCENDLTPQQAEELKKKCQNLNDVFKDGFSRGDIDELYKQCDASNDDVLLGEEVDCVSNIIQVIEDCSSVKEYKST